MARAIAARASARSTGSDDDRGAALGTLRAHYLLDSCTTNRLTNRMGHETFIRAEERRAILRSVRSGARGRGCCGGVRWPRGSRRGRLRVCVNGCAGISEPPVSVDVVCV